MALWDPMPPGDSLDDFMEYWHVALPCLHEVVPELHFTAFLLKKSPDSGPVGLVITEK